MLNRIRAQLRMRGHPNRALQSDWEADGPDAFQFEVVDLLAPPDAAEYDPSDDLALLEELWRDKLGVSAEVSY
jgi:hypothetical protein